MRRACCRPPSDPAAAQSAYEKAMAIQPNFFAGAAGDWGCRSFNRRIMPRAAPHLEKAISLGLEDARLHNFLGICYSRMNQLQLAIKSYRTALKLDPSMADAHLNLAYALQRAGNATKAQLEYRAACRLEAKYCGAVPKANR